MDRTGKLLTLLLTSVTSSMNLLLTYATFSVRGTSSRKIRSRLLQNPISSPEMLRTREKRFCDRTPIFPDLKGFSFVRNDLFNP